MTTQNNNNAQIVSLKADLVRLESILALYKEVDTFKFDNNLQVTMQVRTQIAECKKQIKEFENVALTTPTKEVKKLIKKEFKKVGSHLGTVKAALEMQYPNVEWSEYREFAKEVEQKKYANVETKIRASVRFQ